MELRPGESGATVMVTVKTYPNPSQSYGETVCVAGVRLDRGKPEWIRLYPVKFRTADLDARFKKYEIIEIPGTYRGADDPRPESFKPRQDGIVHGSVVDSSKNWRERRDLVGGLLGATTTCDLIRANPAGEMAKPAPSLGLIKPTVRSVEVLPGDPWTSAERAKVEAASVPDLFGSEIPPLEAAPYPVRYKYNCAHPLCTGHNQKVWGVPRILDSRLMREDQDHGTTITSEVQSAVQG